jgi:hypothetical protein
MMMPWQWGLLSQLVHDALLKCPSREMSDDWIREFVKAEVPLTINRAWEEHLRRSWPSTKLPPYDTLSEEVDFLVEYYSVRLYAARP